MKRNWDPAQRIAPLLLTAAALAPVASRAQPVLTPPRIQNIQVVQRPGTMFVDITYDLVDPDSTNIYVIAEFSQNGGMTYGLPIFSLSGDIGPVRPGANRHIVWNAWNDWAGNYTTNGRIRLTADDSNSALPPPPTNAPAPNLVWIPSGPFDMQRIGRLVNLTGGSWMNSTNRGFWMGRFEVTQGEWVTLMTNNPSHHTGNTNLPVEQVSWDDAVQYCQRLTAQERAAGHIPSDWAYRLPTEAEWEYACRAGTTNTFPYGEDPGFVRLQAYAWYDANSSGFTQPVGAKVPNQWGLFDMMGNVWEMCSDYSDALATGNFTDPQGPVSGSQRVLRGAAYQTVASTFAFYRNAIYVLSAVSYNYAGFRVVLAATP